MGLKGRAEAGRCACCASMSKEEPEGTALSPPLAALNEGGGDAPLAACLPLRGEGCLPSAHSGGGVGQGRDRAAHPAATA